MNYTSASVAVGATKALTATVSPSTATNKSVTWTSSNTTVATVTSAGVVTGKAAGTATITVKTADGGYTATCTVTVSNPTVKVTGVSLSPTSASINVGATKTLTATVSPSTATNKSVTWTSGNTTVATVSATGVVTGKAAGTATITVKTADGGYTATCAVTVTSTSSSNPYAALKWRYFFRNADQTDNTNISYGQLIYKSSHLGIDVWANTGTPLYSVTDGIVISKGYVVNEDDGSITYDAERGYYVGIKTNQTVNGNSLTVRYLHMDQRPRVEKNDPVNYTTMLGVVGDKGKFKEERIPHLHFDVNIDGTASGKKFTLLNTIDPQLFWPSVVFGEAGGRQNNAFSIDLFSTGDLNNSTTGQIIDDQLINYVGANNFDTWVNTASDSELTLKGFKEHFNISDSEFDSLILKYNLMIYTHLVFHIKNYPK